MVLLVTQSPVPAMDDDFRALLLTLSPSSREHLCRVPIRDQVDRDAMSSQLIRCRDERGDDRADIIDMLTMHPEARRKGVRLLAEIEAGALDVATATRPRSRPNPCRPHRSRLARENHGVASSNR
jgi:hypothetical protein